MSSQEFFAALRDDAKKGPTPRRESGGEVLFGACGAIALCHSSPRAAMAKSNRTAGTEEQSFGLMAKVRPLNFWR